MRHRLLSGACLACFLCTTTILFGQGRSFRAERLVLDDANGSTITIQTPAGPIAGGTLTIPDPAGSTTGSFLISTPSGGTQDVAGDLLPGTDATYDLGSPSFQWQDIFASGAVSVGSLGVVEPGGADRTMLVAQTQTGDITYTLPASVGTAGTVLSIAASPAPTAATATLQWAAASGGAGFGAVGGIVYVRKGGPEGVTSNTTLQPDDHLSVALNANQSYEVEGILYVTTTNNGHDLSIALNVPAGATMKVAFHAVQTTGTTNRESDVLTVSGTAGTNIDLASTARAVVFIRGTVKTSATADLLALWWADTNAGGTQTVTLETDSYLKVTRIQ